MRVLALLALLPLAAAQPAEQVWITTTGKPGEMAVSWATQGAGAASEAVAYGPTPALALAATAASSVYSDSMATPIRIHIATLTGLLDNTRYYYAVGGNTTGVRSFTSAPQRPGGKIYAVFADFGVADDYSLPSLLAEAAAGAFDAVVFGGGASARAPPPRPLSPLTPSPRLPFLLHEQTLRTTSRTAAAPTATTFRTPCRPSSRASPCTPSRATTRRCPTTPSPPTRRASRPPARWA